MANGNSSSSTTTGQQQQQHVGSSFQTGQTKESRGGNSRGALLLLLTSGFFMIGLLFDYMPIIVDSQIKRTIELATNDEIQSIWSRPPVDIHSYYWLYDITNPDQFMEGDRVKVRKVGPFHFTSRLEKSIVEVSKNKYRLVYNSTRRIKFNESEQSEPIDAPLHLLNPIFIGMLESARQLAEGMDDQGKLVTMSSVQRLASKYNESLLIKLSPREALMGRKVELFTAVRKMIKSLDLDMKLPALVDGNIFGYVAVQNNTWSGPTEIYTGYQASMSSLGDIISHLGQRRLTHFRGRCNRLQASAGELRPMPINEDQQLEIFRPELCRIVRLQPTGVLQLREGRAVSYKLAQEDFASAKTNPDNQCFCINTTSNSSTASDFCSLDGVIELAPCTLWVPLVLNVGGIQLDAKITNSIQDWDPELLLSDVELIPKFDPKRQLLILKRLGVPIQVDLTITMFMRVVRNDRSREMKSIPEVSYVPLVMAREIATIPPNLAGIVVNLESFLALTQHLKLVMYLSAIVLLCWLTGYYYNRATQDHQTVRPSSDGRNPSAQSGSSSGQRTSRGKRTTRSVSNSQPAELAPGELMNSSSSTINTNTTQVLCEDDTNVMMNSQNRDSSDRRTIINNSMGIGKRPHQPALIFSKVDELRGITPLRQPESASFEPITISKGTDVIRETEEQQSQEQASDESGKIPRAEEQSGEAENDRRTGDLASSLRRKNWFVKVYSNFVRMLTDIRTTISDASQLDVSANDYQDKQLEMLAGKIDNWQRLNSSPVENSTSGAPNSAQAADSLNDDDSSGAEQRQEEDKREKICSGEDESNAKTEKEMQRELDGEENEDDDNMSASTNNNNNDLATERRADSVQERESVHSSQTIIQKSGDDRARALEQMERALETSLPDPAVAAAAVSEDPEEKAVGRADRLERVKLMINSANGTDSPPELEVHIAASIMDATASPTARIRVEKPLNEGIDESTLSVQEDRSQPSKASGAGGLNKSEPTNDNNDTTATASSQASSSEEQTALTSNGSNSSSNGNLVRQVAKDERRDSGVKLDSSSGSNNNLNIQTVNGISGKEVDASVNLETSQTTNRKEKVISTPAQLFQDQLVQVVDKQEPVADLINKMELKVTNGNSNKITTTSTTTDLKQQLLQSKGDFLRQSKQIREGDTINNNNNNNNNNNSFSIGARTKLLNGDANSNGNHISNGKIILLRQTNERVGTIDF